MLNVHPLSCMRKNATRHQRYYRAGDAAANRAKHGDNSSSDQGPTRLTSFGDDSTVSLALSIICRNEALVDKSAEAPKSCLSPVEMCTPTAAGGLLPAGTASTVMRTIFPPPPLIWNFCPTEEVSVSTKTSIQT